MPSNKKLVMNTISTDFNNSYVNNKYPDNWLNYCRTNGELSWLDADEAYDIDRLYQVGNEEAVVNHSHMST